MIDATFNDGILEICINRPESKNALNRAMYDRLTELFDEYGDNDSCVAIILYGAGGVFTAGADLKDFQQKREPGDSPAVRFLRSLSRAKPPVIAAVEGFAIGIGTTLLQHCDFVYATASTRCRLPFAALGLCPEGGSSLLLEQIVGRRKARDWLMTCRFFDGQEAHDAGYITELTDSGKTLEKARETAQALAKIPQNSLRATKEMLSGWHQPDLQKAFDNEVLMFAKCLATNATQDSIKQTGKV
ncbi:enoyl-CoA hydratase/isomerase family protein [Verticiella sediminum]|nr:enoyl-CoA hydratase-related protein [Verticiella sediminum]